jgi:hypothetical protein
MGLGESMVVTTIPGTDPLATTNGVAQIGPARGAWFKDPEGNFLGLRDGRIPG